MPIELEVSDAKCVVRLEGEVDIAYSAELKDALMRALSMRQIVELKWSVVTDLDITAIQLFWAARRQAEQTGISLRFDGETPRNIQSLIVLAGFESLDGRSAPESVDQPAAEYAPRG